MSLIMRLLNNKNKIPKVEDFVTIGKGKNSSFQESNEPRTVLDGIRENRNNWDDYRPSISWFL
jgi:hypothetical protein